MGAWSPRGATGWCGTPGLVANDSGLAVEACGGDRPVNRQAARLGTPAAGQPVQEQPTSRARAEPAMTYKQAGGNGRGSVFRGSGEGDWRPPGSGRNKVPSARARIWEETPHRLGIGKRVKRIGCSCGRNYGQSSHEEGPQGGARTRRLAQERSPRLKPSEAVAWSHPLWELPTSSIP